VTATEGTAGAAEVIGDGPRVVLVHGSVTNAKWTWAKQRELADRFTLVFVNRGGYPPNPPLEYIDFSEQAKELASLLEPGTHLVGYSYGGVVSLLAAELRPDALRSLTLVEPPALWLAHGTPEVDQLGLDVSKLYWLGPSDPRRFLEEFMSLFGTKLTMPAVLPADIEQGVRALMVERPPWDARFRFDELRDAGYPKLVISGGHSAAFEAVCDVLQERLGADRAVVPSSGHNIPNEGEPFNEALSAFISRAEAAAV